MGGIGHNGGPMLEGGTSWRRHCWGAAREALLPTLPVEVVRLRVRRAAELGLDYRTYAGVRATTGRDIVAFLFSSNALRLVSPQDPMPPSHATRLAAVQAGIALAAHPPLDPAAVAAHLEGQGIAVSGAIRAPGLFESWQVTRERFEGLLAAARHPRDGVVVVGETALERDWVAAARLAAFIPAARYFG
jgi:hypothetical protein